MMRFILKGLIIPIYIFVILLQWALTFLITFSSVIFNTLVGIFFIIVILGICTPFETLRTLALSLGTYLVPIVSTWSIYSIVRARVAISDFIKG